mmetsp:Transcript_5516/g.12250  ORF Transcript_5516/g.12250 Transcript_5516/m.12250 type:complete len:90 (-) Transcript_5516:87-356(-)
MTVSVMTLVMTASVMTTLATASVMTDQWRQVCEEVLQDAGCAIVVADYSPLQKRAPRPSIRLSVCAAHTQDQLERCAAAIGRAAARLLD